MWEGRCWDDNKGEDVKKWSASVATRCTPEFSNKGGWLNPGVVRQGQARGSGVHPSPQDVHGSPEKRAHVKRKRHPSRQDGRRPTKGNHGSPTCREKILKSVLITTVFSVTEGDDLCLKTAVFRKTDHEYPVFAHPAGRRLVLFGSLGEDLPVWVPRRRLVRFVPWAKTCPFRSLGEDLSVWLTNLKSGPSAWKL